MKKFWMVLIGLLIVSSLLLTACQPAATETTVVEEPAPVEEASPEASAPAEEAAPTEEVAPTEEAPAEAPATDVVKGGTLYWHSSASVTFDPPFIVDGPSFNVASQIYSFLFRVKEDGTVIPDLAESWE